MSSRKGELRVNVVSARGLRDTAIFGIQDPYVQLIHGSLKVKTAVHRDGGTSPVWNESIKLNTSRDASTKLVVKVKNANTLHDNRIGSTEVDLSDVFANYHEEVSAPLFTRDGRQKGEVQLMFTFKPYDAASLSSSPHESQAHLDGLGAQQASPSSSRVSGSARVTAEATADISPQKHKGSFEFAPNPELSVEGLGPLGQSFLNLAMAHISPEKPDQAEILDDHKYLKLGAEPQGTSGGPAPGAAESGPNQTALQTPEPTQSSASQPFRRNFYPEEASDEEEATMHSPHQHQPDSESLSAFPAAFRFQQPAADAAATSAAISDAQAATSCSLDNASYSSQEVYNAYQRPASFSAQNSSSPGYHAEQTRQGLAPPQGSYEQPYQVPQWRLLGTNPLHEGQQGMQGPYLGQGFQQQPQGIQQQALGFQQQPQVPQWRLLGTSPLHEGHVGHMQSQSYPNANGSDQSWGQGTGQGSQPQPHRPDWHLLGTSPMHDNAFGVDYSTGTSQASFTQGKGGLAQPLTYASMAIGSWTDSSKTARQYLGKQDDLRVNPSAPSLPTFVTADRQTSSSSHHSSLGNISQSPDKLRRPSDDQSGRPPLWGRASPTPTPAEHYSLSFSDLGVDKKFALGGANHDRKSVI